MRRWINGRALRSALAVAGVLLASRAEAAQYLYTVTGHVILDDLTFDELQLFGPRLDSAFRAAFVVDDAMAQAIYSYGPSGSSATGAGTVAPGTLPPVRASLTIGAASYAIRQGNSASGPLIGSDGGPYGATSLERDSGSIHKATGNRQLNLTATYYREAFCCFPAGYQFDASADYLDFDLRSAAFTNPDYRQLGTFALTSGGGYFSSYVQSGPFPGPMTQIRLQGQALTVTSLAAVPEIGTWMMIIGGVGAAGAAKRRRGRLGGFKAAPA